MILSTSDTEKVSFLYLLISLFCAVFGGIYEVFSHEVYSFYMLYAFLIPLAGGALPFFLINILPVKYPCRIARNLYHSGIATLTAGSIVYGALEIYGTTNTMIKYYLIVGLVLLAAGIIIFLIQILKDRLIRRTSSQ